MIIQESIQKLRTKGREALDQSQSSDPTALTPAELDRLGGKTHLISEELCTSMSSPSTSSNLSLPSDGGPEPMNMDNLHPRIVQDMKAFDIFDMSTYNSQTRGGEFLFDLPSDAQAMAGVQYQDSSIYGDVFSMMTETRQPTFLTNGFSPGPPVLDATWQSFVEQLGF